MKNLDSDSCQLSFPAGAPNKANSGFIASHTLQFLQDKRNVPCFVNIFSFFFNDIDSVQRTWKLKDFILYFHDRKIVFADDILFLSGCFSNDEDRIHTYIYIRC